MVTDRVLAKLPRVRVSLPAVVDGGVGEAGGGELNDIGAGAADQGLEV